jgi:DNA-binding NarL/FixJ family response regulator
MKEHLDVLVADDTLIAREGWRAILETTDEVRVVGEAITIEDVYFQTQQLCPDVVLLDVKWGSHKQAGLAAILKLKRECPDVKIVAISAYEELLARARGLGADGALPKSFSRDELLATIKAVCFEQPGEDVWAVRLQLDATEYANRLAGLKPGRRDARRYEELLAEVLPFLFEGHLTDFESQCRHHEGEEIWDIVAYSNSGAPFWETIRQQHQTGQILFELKNVGTLRSAHVLQLVGYLGDPLMHFGVIVARNAPTQGAVRQARRTLERSGGKKVILILGDDEILEMLRVKAGGGDPSDCLRHIYLAFVRGV